MRNRAISLSDKPTDGLIGRKIGRTIVGVEDGWRKATVSAGPSVTNGCCSVVPVSWVPSEKSGSKGVTIILALAWMELVGLSRRCTKVTIPITAKQQQRHL